MSDTSPRYEEVEAGQELPPLVKTPNEVQVFMFSAITWDTHRTHFDTPVFGRRGVAARHSGAWAPAGRLSHPVRDAVGRGGGTAAFDRLPEPGHGDSLGSG